jgi:enamine deaminase RidA (YjgF/YER057c/UK114 family)
LFTQWAQSAITGGGVFAQLAGLVSGGPRFQPAKYKEHEHPMSKTRTSVSSGTAWEEMAGYARAVRVGDRILVSGTTATGPSGLVGGADPAAQARYAIDKIAAAIEQLGGRLEDVVRTRVYVSSVEHWQPVAIVHGERFGHIRPANSLVEARLVGPEYLVEIEAEAVVGAGDAL